MKRFIPLLLILFSLIAVSPVQAGDLRMANRHGAYVVEIAINRNPPIVGDNRIEISITDGNGRRVSEAQVLVNYYMPPMPRMAPMNYTTPAKIKGEHLPGHHAPDHGRPLDHRPENHPGRQEVHQ